MSKEISLQNKAMNSVLWSTIQKFGSIAITFLANVVLARLLTPADFGCVGMLMIFIYISNTLIDGGFSSALIQKKNPTQTDYSTIFYLNILISVSLYSILFFASPFIAAFYNLPLLDSILKIQGIILIVNALGSVQANRFRKRLDFKILSIVELTSATLSLAAAIIAAYKGLGVWSLVIQQVCLSSFRTILYWIVSKWKPLIIFSCKSFKELFNFGSFILLSNIFETLSNEIQGMLVGKMFTPSMLGFYTQAYRLEAAIATIVSGFMDQVTFPIMASIQDEKEKLILVLKKFIQMLAFVCAPLMGLGIVIAHPLIKLIYGDQWLASVPYFQILCSAGIAVCLQGAASNSISAIGKSKILFKWSLFKRSSTMVFCFVGILLAGMYGLLWACAAGAWLVYIVNTYLIAKYIGYRISDQLKDILPFILLTIAVAGAVFYVGKLLPLNEFTTAAIQSILFISLYAAGSYILNFEVTEFLKNVIIAKKK